VQEAFRLGAVGYVSKIDAGSELLAAVDAVLRGGRFVSAKLAEHVPAELSDRQTRRLYTDEVASPANRGD